MGEPAELPKWMSAIDSFNFVKATGLGFALAGLNAKNLLMCAAAGAGIGSARLTGADTAVAVAVFTVIAGSTVLIPVVGYAVAKERMRRPLDELKAWLQTNITSVMGVLLLVLGVTLIGKGKPRQLSALGVLGAFVSRTPECPLLPPWVCVLVRRGIDDQGAFKAYATYRKVMRAGAEGTEG